MLNLSCGHTLSFFLSPCRSDQHYLKKAGPGTAEWAHSRGKPLHPLLCFCGTGTPKTKANSILDTVSPSRTPLTPSHASLENLSRMESGKCKRVIVSRLSPLPILLAPKWHLAVCQGWRAALPNNWKSRIVCVGGVSTCVYVWWEGFRSFALWRYPEGMRMTVPLFFPSVPSQD